MLKKLMFKKQISSSMTNWKFDNLIFIIWAKLNWVKSSMDILLSLR